MKQLILILALGTIGQCYAGTLDADTIDNWQIYNGTELVLAGHDSPSGMEFLGTIKKNDLKDLNVQYNHCVRYIKGFDVVLEVTDEDGRYLMMKEFKSGEVISIGNRELGSLTTKSIIIRYREKRENGTDRILGRIRFLLLEQGVPDLFSRVEALIPRKACSQAVGQIFDWRYES